MRSVKRAPPAGRGAFGPGGCAGGQGGSGAPSKPIRALSKLVGACRFREQMTNLDPDGLLQMLRDPNRETQEIAAAAGAPREEAARASRLVLGIAKAKPEEVLALPPPLAVAVLRAAAAAHRGDLLALAAGHRSKDVAKEGKRALYLLKTRGVPVPDLKRQPPPPAAPAPEPSLPCYASIQDGFGERAVWIGRHAPGKGVEVGQAVISDQKGIVSLQLGLLGRKEYRVFGRDLLSRGDAMGLDEIDLERAKGLVAAGRKLNEASGTPLPDGADAWLARLGPATPPPDPAQRFSPLPEGEEQAAVDVSGELHDLPLVRPWLADEDALRTLAHKLDEIGVSRLYVDERQRSEATLGALADAIEQHFDAARRALWASRLFTLADHLERTGDLARARVAAAVARALPTSAPAARIPFARLLFEKAFPAVAPRAEVPAPPSGALIVPPAR